MLELLQITNDPALAARCDALGGFRLFVDLERTGKAERQAGRGTFISEHQLEDVPRVKSVLRRSRLMVRVNPLHPGSGAEIDAVLACGPDCVMLPMFTGAAQLREFSAIVAGRAPIVALLETAGALDSLDSWIGTAGLEEIFVGLNDLHLSLGMRFMFEPLANGQVAHVAAAAQRRGLRFGFGGIARLDQGLLPGREVLAEQVRLGSGAVILARAFRRDIADAQFESEIAALRREEARLRDRSPEAAERDRVRICARITEIADGLPAAG
jgi:2-keto-3-deoxy-L-rhamnonate aldolase RhmA